MKKLAEISPDDQNLKIVSTHNEERLQKYFCCVNKQQNVKM